MEKMRDIQTIRHTENKYQNDTNNLCLISNYLKCKWIKLLNQKSEIERMDFFKKSWSNYMFCLQETHFRSKDTNKLKLKGWENKFHENSNQKWCEVAIQISDKIDFSQNLSQKTKKGHYISIKDLIHKNILIFINTYAPVES